MMEKKGAPLLFLTFNKHEQSSLSDAMTDKRDCCNDELGYKVTCGCFGNHYITHYHCSEKGVNSILPVYRVLRNTKHSAVIMVGIACGANVKESNQSIGDVLLCDKVMSAVGWRIGKQTRIPRDANPSCGDKLKELFSGEAYSWNGCKNELGIDAVVHIGSIISGSSLLDNVVEKRNIFKRFYNEPIGYEMEGYALVLVCTDREVHTGEWLIVKGISDWGDGNKNSQNTVKNQQLAAGNAVNFCLQVLSNRTFSDAATCDTTYYDPFENIEDSTAQALDLPNVCLNDSIDQVKEPWMQEIVSYLKWLKDEKAMPMITSKTLTNYCSDNGISEISKIFEYLLSAKYIRLSFSYDDIFLYLIMIGE